MATDLILCRCGDPERSHGANGCAVVGCFCAALGLAVRCDSEHPVPLLSGRRIRCALLTPHDDHKHYQGGRYWGEGRER